MGLGLFGRKDKKDNRLKDNQSTDNSDIARVLMTIADRIMEKRQFDKSSILLFKLAVEYNVLNIKNEIDENSLLLEKLEEYTKESQKEVNSGKRTIFVFENLPDLVKSVEIDLELKKKHYLELKKSAEGLMEFIDFIMRDRS